MKKWKIALAAACVCFLFTVAYSATAGSQTDPLVTKSYLDGPFMEQVQSFVDQAVGERKSVFTAVTLSQGQTLEGDVGCEVVLRDGTAVCGTPDGVGLLDTTAGTDLGDGKALAANHLYMVTVGARTVTATSETVKVLARGPYTVR